jgi:hypothetical protein
MHKAVEEREEENSETFEERSTGRVERPCRSCENLIGVAILNDLNECGRVPLSYNYSCRGGLFLSAVSKEDGGCPINSFKPREDGEMELTPESLRENGFRKLSYEKDFAKKMDPNHPQAKRYGEIVVHPGEDFLRLIYQIYDVWVKKNDETNKEYTLKVVSRVKHAQEQKQY